MNRDVVRRATPILHDVVQGLAPDGRFDLTIHVADGHPSGEGLHYGIRSGTLDGILIVQCALDTSWVERVWRPVCGLIDDNFILDIDDELVAFVAWRTAAGVDGPYPRSATRYAKLTNEGHLGEPCLGPAPFRNMNFLVQMDVAQIVTDSTKNSAVPTKEGM